MKHELHLGVVDPIRCGCDPDATGGLMPVDEALALALGLAQPPVATERLALLAATGRVLAQCVWARPPLPDSNASTGLGQGTEILSAGRIIGPREVGTLAEAGQGQVVVRRRIEVALLTTGSELADPYLSSTPGAVWSAIHLALAAQLTIPWIHLQDFGALPADPVRLGRVLTVAADQADLIVTTGGIPFGHEDHLPRLVRDLSGTIHVASVAMKPAGSLTIGQIGEAIWIGLPSDPFAALVGWAVIGSRLAEALAGITGGGPRKQVVRLASPAAHHPGRCEFRLGHVLGYDAHGAQVVELLPSKVSHSVALLAQADGLALIPADAEALAAGTLVEFLPF